MDSIRENIEKVGLSDLIPAEEWVKFDQDCETEAVWGVDDIIDDIVRPNNGKDSQKNTEETGESDDSAVVPLVKHSVCEDSLQNVYWYLLQHEDAPQDAVALNRKHFGYIESNRVQYEAVGKER